MKSPSGSQSNNCKATAAVIEAVKRVLVGRQIHDQSIVVAVSGGADSVALLTVLSRLKADLRLELIVAHFDHRLRADSGADAAWVERLGQSMGLQVRVGEPSSNPPGTHVEEWARGERYAFLLKTAHEFCAGWVAIGHTANDQAETVLHHVLRGTGLKGLSGIPQSRKLDEHTRLIRPFLSLERRQLEEFLGESRQDFLVDQSNDDLRLTRNALRRSLLPEVRRRFNPQVDQALVRLAEQSRDAVRFLRRTARRALKSSHLETTRGHIRLSTRELKRLDEIVVREVAVMVWTRMRWPRQRMSFAHWKRAASLLKGAGPARADFPGGVWGERRKELVVWTRRPPESSGSRGKHDI